MSIEAYERETLLTQRYVQCKYKTTEILRLNDTIYKISLTPIVSRIPYKAGEYFQLLCSDKKFRSYSIVNVPDSCGRLIIHMRAASEAVLAKYGINVGSTIEVRGPFGKCAYNFNSLSPVIFLAEGIALATFNSIFDSSNYLNEYTTLIWLRSARDSDYSALKIEEWRNKIKNFNFIELERSASGYAEALNKCKEFLALYPSINFYLAGSKDIYNYLFEKIFKKNPQINLFSDI